MRVAGRITSQTSDASGRSSRTGASAPSRRFLCAPFSAAAPLPCTRRNRTQAVPARRLINPSARLPQPPATIGPSPDYTVGSPPAPPFGRPPAGHSRDGVPSAARPDMAGRHAGDASGVAVRVGGGVPCLGGIHRDGAGRLGGRGVTVVRRVAGVMVAAPTLDAAAIAFITWRLGLNSAAHPDVTAGRRSTAHTVMAVAADAAARRPACAKNPCDISRTSLPPARRRIGAFRAGGVGGAPLDACPGRGPAAIGQAPGEPRRGCLPWRRPGIAHIRRDPSPGGCQAPSGSRVSGPATSWCRSWSCGRRPPGYHHGHTAVRPFPGHRRYRGIWAGCTPCRGACRRGPPGRRCASMASCGYQIARTSPSPHVRLGHSPSDNGRIISIFHVRRVRFDSSAW